MELERFQQIITKLLIAERREHFSGLADQDIIAALFPLLNQDATQSIFVNVQDLMRKSIDELPNPTLVKVARLVYLDHESPYRVAWTLGMDHSTVTRYVKQVPILVARLLWYRLYWTNADTSPAASGEMAPVGQEPLNYLLRREYSFTQREAEIGVALANLGNLLLSLEGLANLKGITLSKSGLKTHLRRMYVKLDVHEKKELIERLCALANNLH